MLTKLGIISKHQKYYSAFFSDSALSKAQSILKSIFQAKNRVKDGNPQGTPHPIITRRGSMKSLAQSEASCWTEDLSDKEDDKKSLDRSEICCGQSENDKNDGASQKSDSAYGSRGSIQSPNGRFVPFYDDS